MRFKKGTGFKETIERRMPMYSAAADCKKGALVRMGATPATDGGLVILGDSALTDIIGLMGELYDYSVAGSSVVGTSEVLKTVLINPLAILEAQYDLTDTMAATHAAATTALTLTTLEDNIDGAFLYVKSGTAIGQLRALTASAAGSCTLLSAFSPALAVSDTLIKILPRNHRLVYVISTMDKIGTDVAAGSGVARVLENFITSKSRTGKQILRYATHSGLNNLNSDNVSFSAEIAPLDGFLNPLS